jgi:hypothetical protein
MVLTPQERRTLAQIETQLSNDAPELAALLAPGRVRRWAASNWKVSLVVALSSLLALPPVVAGTFTRRPVLVGVGVGVAVFFPGLTVLLAARLRHRPKR